MKKKEKKPQPVARGQLTREHIVTSALRVLDEEGFDGVTMRRLADELGVKAASLYNHVRDKDELLALMADSISAELPTFDHTKPWREQAEGLAKGIRRVLKKHRDGARVMAATPPVGPNRLRAIEQLLDAITKAGFPRSTIPDIAFLTSSFIIGFVLDETMGQPSDGASARRRQQDARRWMKSLPAAEFPNLVSLADELVGSEADRRFELGIRALLDGFDRLRAT
jgi:TetR/AcrR family transcriptional regulator, tetracycline repressor protein